ncbi:4-hydroxy-3-methylbut-2-en-1-yl diphosphate synthase [Limihaloglobus sulfuriphilus]|uniref:4-hydroxy-3-methylbut-2-en-1-yl diphosphate synthase (flavodoxin) n=2 Tax=Limihaloglobus sulfuriphilus TaxID=1851148 RepID=A0A1Q2MD34_9BACT|nr:4-hydroxy-3-methylbut-2-en-1-yl diphosphate synthase [Limihaloglobus sulfuriphilus]
MVGDVGIGSKHPVVIQSMTNTLTTDVAATLSQVKKLAAAGCRIVRVAVPTEHDTKALKQIIDRAPVPIVADIHFSPARAVEAIEAGAAKIRLNPGNIKDKNDLNRIIDCAKQHKIAIRTGVNEASIRDLKNDTPPDGRVPLMLRELTGYVRLFEKGGFANLVLSAKSTDPVRTIEINRAISEKFHYPVHIGLTHAGLPEHARIPTAVVLGTLLSEGIGDTIRVSLAGDPVKEPQMSLEILQSIGLARRVHPELTVCPTCGRCQTDVIKLARTIDKEIKKINKPLKIAVMGCVVNGPGEAADSDIAVCAGKNKGFIYKNGKKVASVPESQIAETLFKMIEQF